MDFTYGMGKQGGFPAVSMTQQAALRYCKWLYDKTGLFYRLPTEAEWEYACRAGTTTDYSFDNNNNLKDHAWYYDNSFEKYHKVGEKKPNAWGLYDMHGNVAEWTLDFYVKDYFNAIESTTDPWIKPTKKHSRTVKGGSFDDNPEQMTSAFRLKSSPKWQARDPQIPKSKWWNPDSSFVGFRIVRPFKKYTHEEILAFFEVAIKD
jgi:formylglycine-generating enzyme required for sulfatase activity